MLHCSIQLRRWALGALAGVVAAIAGACDKPTTLGVDPPEYSTGVDSAAIMAAAGSTFFTASYGVIPVPAGAKVTVTVAHVETARCEIVSVSGAINQPVFPQGVGGCGRGGIENDGLGLTTTIGPVARAGDISFRISSTGGSIVSGTAPNYTVSLFDAVGQDTNDVVLSVKVEAVTTKPECLPTPVQRGDNVRCTLTVPDAYRVLTRGARGSGFNISETPGTSHAAGETYVWEGTAVADSRVTLRIETNENGATKQQSFSASFKVSERPWPVPGFSQVIKAVGLTPPMQPYPAQGTPIGGARPEPDPNVWPTLPITRPTQGPNTGLGFLTSPLPDFPWKVYMHPALYPTPAGLQAGQPGYQPWHRWNDDQNGQGSGTCTAAVFTTLIPEVERHEGVTGAPDSHYGVAIKAYNDLKPQQRIERLYTAADDYALRQRAFNEWMGFHQGGAYQSRQNAFDASDYPKVAATIGCNLDYNASDR